MGGGNPASSEVTTDLPDWAKPYYERALGRVEASSLTPYQQYSGDRLANAADYGNIGKAQGIVSNLGGVQGLGAAQDYSKYAMDQSKALGNYTPTQTTASQFSPYAGYKAGTADPYSDFKAGTADPYSDFKAGTANPYSDFKAANYSQAQFKPYSNFQAGAADPYSQFQESQFNEYNYDPSRQFSGQEVQNYMNPYMQNVVDQQSKSAITNFNRQNASRAAQGVQAGAFGGSRQGVVQGMAEEGLMGQLDQIQGKGLQDSYTQAMSAFQSDRAAQVSNEQARAAEAARVQSAGGSEAARVQQAQAAELARTQGIGLDEASRVQAAQAAEAARTQSGIAGNLVVYNRQRVQIKPVFSRHKLRNSPVLRVLALTKPHVFNKRKPPRWPVHKVLALTKRHVFSRHKQGNSPVHRVLVLMRRHVFRQGKLVNSLESKPLTLLKWPACSNRTKLLISLVQVKVSLL
jgi:hypothetical protein